MGDSRRSFKLDIGFIDHLKVVNTNNHNTIAIVTLYKSLHAKSSPACSIFTRLFLVTDFNSGDSSALRPQVLSSQTPVQN
jgi:hypothetical protein